VAPPAIRDILASRELIARDRQHQEDIYFIAPEGRLKLRTIRTTGDRGWAELIGYRRGDLVGSRWSTYGILPLTVEQGSALVPVLEQAIPVWVRVRKSREIFLLGSTRIHLDTVEELGAFVELETVISDQAPHDAEREHQYVIDLLGLESCPVIAGSYSDLLAAKHGTPESETRAE